MVRIIMCDDEPATIKRYEERLRQLGEKHHVEISIKSFTDAEKLFFYMDDPSVRVDLIYMDVMMPGTDGLTAAEKLRGKGYNGELIFLTKRSENAIRGYDVQAFHYILKDDGDRQEFERIFLTAVDQIRSRTREYITIQGIGESRNIPIREISYFSVYNRIITVHYGKQSFEFYSSMEKVEAAMLEYGFLRVHRGYLISVDYIQSMTAEKVIMSDGTEINFSRKQARRIREMIQEKQVRIG